MGHAVTLAKDQAGCRFLQSQIDQRDDLFKIVFDSTISDFAELMRDPFGNYLVQKLVESCTEDQLSQVVQTVKDEPLAICKDLHGTRSV